MGNGRGKNDQNKAGLISILSLCLIIVGLLFVLFSTIMGYNTTFLYGLAVTVWVVLYLILADILEPYYSGVLSNMTKVQGKSYIKYVLADMTGMICLSLFVLNSSDIHEKIHYVFLALFILLLIPKNILYHMAVKESAVKNSTVRSVKPEKTVRKYKPTAGGRASEDRRIKMVTLETFDDPKLFTDRFEEPEEKSSDIQV